jgi:DNA-binding beta-propeller fold protein YncE
MLKNIVLVVLLLCAADVSAGVNVTTVDLAGDAGIPVNAAGPLLVQIDDGRNRLIAANTLTSSISIIDCATHAVRNIPLGGRAFQHLKAEAMTYDRRTGDIYLIGARCIFVVSPESGEATTIDTEYQYESIAVDPGTGNAFVAGRESAVLGVIESGSKKVREIPWLEHAEPLINLNQTPPPPIRKVVADGDLKQIMAVDGFTPTLYRFDAGEGALIASRPLPLTAGGRYHLAGYNEEQHLLYLVVETDKRRVIEAARIDCLGEDDIVVPLPEFTEGVGIIYNPAREEVYIPYDNFPSVHVVSFGDGGSLDEIAIPAYGNDASAVDRANDLLYVASWAFGEIDIISLESRTLLRRITGLGIIPHMFTIAFNPNNNLLYFPKGATAVNGTFGSAITAFDPEKETTEKIYLGWAPVDLIEIERRGSFLVIGAENRFAEVHPDGRYETHVLPYDYPVEAIRSPAGNVYLSYGPHQSYWPTVYIWDAKNGILTIDAESFEFYDRRIPRQAQRMVVDGDGALYFTQNNWGKEEQFIGTLPDEVRVYEPGKRLRLGSTVERETTQRILRYDPDEHRLYLVKIGERDDDPSMLQIIDPAEKAVVDTVLLGVTATDLVFDDKRIYVANFDSRSVSIIDKNDLGVSELQTGEQPLRLCRCSERIYVACHGDNTLREVLGKRTVHDIPEDGRPDNLYTWNGAVVVVSHEPDELNIHRFDPEEESFELLHEVEYPYGDTRYDSGNSSFYVRGQYGDALFDITQAAVDGAGRLWITDFLAGRVYILEEL